MGQEYSERECWTLGRIDLAGEGLPVAELLAAGHFAEGEPANWKAFLCSIGDVERL